MKKIVSVACFVLLGLVSACTPLVPVARDQLGVSLLTINLRDTYNVPSTITGTTWQVRYKRATDWVFTSGKVPDVIVLQEAPGEWRCTKLPSMGGGPGIDLLGDYEALDFILDELRNRLAVDYRIAYLLSHKQSQGEGGGWVGSQSTGFCPARGGRAVLYRADKLRNTQSNVGFEFDDERHTAPHLLNSLPCCNPTRGHEDVCAKIDGPMRTGNGCTRAVPSAAAWTKRQSSTDNPLDAVFSRFELVKQPGNFIHIYNVHLSWKKTGPARTDETPAFGAQSINELIDAMEARYKQMPTTLLYPPIVLGDFNLDSAAATGFFPKLRTAIWSPEVMGVFFGKESNFPSKQTAYANQAEILPTFGCVPVPNDLPAPEPLTLWSDHCASIYLRVEPAP